MKRKIKKGILILYLFVISFILFAQAKTGKVIADDSSSVEADENRSVHQKKIALVIGNRRNSEKGQAKFITDALSVSAILSEDNFTVTTVLEGDQRKLLDSIQQFSRDIKKADVSFFYYAGDGLQSASVNYLIPAQCCVKTAEELTWKAVNMNDVLDSIYRAKCKTNLIMIDTCLADINGSKKSGNRALSLSTKVYDMESFMAFASIPSSVLDSYKAQTSPFSEALLKHLRESGQDIRVVTGEVAADAKKATENKQIVWTSSTISGQFSLVNEEQNFSDFSYPVLAKSDQQTEKGSEGEPEKKQQPDKILGAKVTIKTRAEGVLFIDAVKIGSLKRNSYKDMVVSNETHLFTMKYTDGYEEKHNIDINNTQTVFFSYDNYGVLSLSGLSPFDIYIDGKKKASIKKDISVQYEIPNGDHTLQAVYRNKYVETKRITLKTKLSVDFTYRDGGSGGDRFVSSLFNPIFGSGSFSQGDIAAGTYVLFGEAVGAGVIGLSYYMRNNWIDMAEEDGYSEDDIDFTNVNYTLYTGIGIAGSALLVAFLKPYIYHAFVSKKKRFTPPSAAAQKSDVSNLSFFVLPTDKNLTLGGRVSW